MCHTCAHRPQSPRLQSQTQSVHSRESVSDHTLLAGDHGNTEHADLAPRTIARSAQPFTRVGVGERVCLTLSHRVPTEREKRDATPLPLRCESAEMCGEICHAMCDVEPKKRSNEDAGLAAINAVRDHH